MSLSFHVEPLNAAAFKQLMKDGDVAFLRMNPNGRWPTMAELRQVLSTFTDFHVEYMDVNGGWQIDIHDREKPASPLFAFLGVEGRNTLRKIEVVRGAPELYLAIVQKLSEMVGPLVLVPRPPLVVSADFGLPFLMRKYKDYVEEVTYWGPPAHLPRPRERELTINIGGKPVLLNAGMIEATVNPPAGFRSKRRFYKTDLYPRIRAVSWFANCGKQLNLELTMPVRPVITWAEATKACKKRIWENVRSEARNQLSAHLHTFGHDRYQRWNHFVKGFKQEIVIPVVERSVNLTRKELGLDETIGTCATEDVLGALLENAYLDCGHSAFFFLELLTVYEAGHFPCGWEGKWPKGTLLVW